MDVEMKRSSSLDTSMYVPRLWFAGAFLLLVGLSIVELALSGSTLSQLSKHEDIKISLETTPAPPATGAPTIVDAPFTFDITAQEWANGADGERPPGFEGKTWKQVVDMAQGTTVSFGAWVKYMGPNYMPFLAKELKEKYGIKLNVVDVDELGGTLPAVDIATKEKNIDMIWMNKKSFLRLRETKQSWGPYANIVPNGAVFDFTDPVISTDFGVATNGEEMPLNIAQFVMAYNKDKIPDTTGSGTTFPPKNIGDLIAQVVNKEIKFHPMSATSFPGEPFLEQFFYHFAGAEYTKYQQDFDEAWWNTQVATVIPKLKEFHEGLYLNTATSVKYGTPADVRALFANGETDLTFEYSPGTVFQKVQSGDFPSRTATYLFDEGTVSNTNFVTIHKAGPNKAGALVAVNLIASMQHQYKRFVPSQGSWNALQAFNPLKKPIQNAGWNIVFDEIESVEGAPSFEELAAKRIPEMTPTYSEKMKEVFAAKIGTGENPIEN